MKKIDFISKLRRTLLICCLTILSLDLYAIIPNNISIATLVMGPDNCIGNCTIQAGASLTITGGATATFYGNIIVEPNATLNIIGGGIAVVNGNVTVMNQAILKLDSGILRMGANTRIILRGGPVAGAFLSVEHNSLIANAKPTLFWSGIEMMRGPNPTDKESRITIGGATSGPQNISYNTIAYAEVAIRNYDKDYAISTTNGGRVWSAFATFKNNKRSLLLYNELRGDPITDPTDNTSGYNPAAFFQYDSFMHTNDFNPGTPPPDMVYLDNCNNITFLSCTFKGNSWPLYNGCDSLCTGVVAVNSSIKMQPYATVRPSFNGMRTGIAITNSLQTNRIPLIYGTDFNTPNGVNMSGCFMPWVMDCSFSTNYFAQYANVDLFLNNCTGYRIEGNRLFGDYGPPGIVVKNSGTAYNEIYRNSIGRSIANVMCVQAIGRNTNSGNSTGLKILCNDLYASAGTSSGYPAGLGYEVTIMKDPSVTLNGVARLQYIEGGSPALNQSAGNRFHNGAEPSNGLNYPSYFIDASTNDLSQFRYGYNFGTAVEQPVYTNIPSSGLINMNTNTCPVHNTGAPPTPFPFALFINKLSAIEEKIATIEAKGKHNDADRAELDGLFTAQAQLIDNMVLQYQFPSAKGQTDQQSNLEHIALVYEQVTQGYQYQLYLASAYMGLGRYDEAISVLNNIADKYPVGAEEQMEIKHIADLYQTMRWLALNEGDWSKMPDILKKPVYEYEQSDAMQAGAIARALLVQYEGRRYEPEYLIPKSTYTFQNNKIALNNMDKIYPNPTTGQLFIKADNNGDVLTITDITGKEVLHYILESSRTTINISDLPAGVYHATIRTTGKITYQQKIVKK
ncbi:T9SS type A sorting domain-containing protein [Taibaiella sp. KBW10]|uniref:T9SS type A sorting domain-containing protein n=1 Tax=Taibaiella sp. KBW10 TaxID=2153357 RepID=UPI0013158E89|nr:T9SS type A sorting domain-containing protein [Taibaiella sp. KBW10]